MPFTVQDLIKDRRKPVVVGLSDSAETAVTWMVEYDFNQLPVVDQDNRPCGMVTSDSILRAHASLGLPLLKLQVRDAMRKKPREFEDGDDLFEMLEYVMDSHAVFIVDGERRLSGIVTSYDTTEYFRRRAEDLMLVEDIEMALRDHIRAAYLGADGTDGLGAAVADLGKDGGGAHGKFKHALNRYLSKTQGKLDEAAADEAFQAAFGGPPQKKKRFEQLTLGEYIQIVVHGSKWKDHFQTIFGIEQDALKFMLEKVRDTRNALAHFRGDLDSAQRNHLRFCTDWLARHPAPPTPNGSPEPGDAPPTAPPPQPEPSADGKDRAQAEDFSPEDSRYAPLAAFLQSQPQERAELTFAEVEKIIGGPLPTSARKHPSWWANDSVGHVQSRQWLEVGWRMLSVNITDAKVTFHRPTERGQAYIAFYTELVDYLDKAAPGVFTATKPIGLNWLNVRYLYSSGSRVGVLAFTFALRSRFRAEVYIDSGDKDRNKALFDKLHAHKKDIESKLGEMGWERLDNKRASRIALYHPGSIDDDPKKLAALRAWGVESLKKLNEVLVPLLEAAQG